MAGAYDYLNARAKAMKAGVLPAGALRVLARCGGLTRLVEALARMPAYASELGGVDLPETAAGCDASLQRSLTAAFGRLWARADDDVRRWLELWLAPWDLANLMGILRGWRSETAAERVPTLWTTTGMLSREELTSLLAAGTVEALARRLAARGGVLNAVARALDRTMRMAKASVEDAMVQAWAEHGAAAIDCGGPDAETFAAFFGWDIDARNVMHALRLSRDRDGDLSGFLRGGRGLSRAVWERIAGAGDVAHALDVLVETPFAGVGRAGLEPRDVPLGEIERQVQRIVLDRFAKLYRCSDPLGIGVLLYVTRLKAVEVGNLRTIGYGLERRLPAGVIEEQLIVAERQGYLPA